MAQERKQPEQDPAEGARDIVDRELERQSGADRSETEERKKPPAGKAKPEQH